MAITKSWEDRAKEKLVERMPKGSLLMAVMHGPGFITIQKSFPAMTGFNLAPNEISSIRLTREYKGFSVESDRITDYYDMVRKAAPRSFVYGAGFAGRTTPVRAALGLLAADIKRNPELYTVRRA